MTVNMKTAASSPASTCSETDTLLGDVPEAVAEEEAAECLHYEVVCRTTCHLCLVCTS